VLIFSWEGKDCDQMDAEEHYKQSLPPDPVPDIDPDLDLDHVVRTSYMLHKLEGLEELTVAVNRVADLLERLYYQYEAKEQR